MIVVFIYTLLYGNVTYIEQFFLDLSSNNLFLFFDNLT